MTRFITRRDIFPSFGLLGEDHLPVCKYTVLAINDSIGDCAAYEGIGPVTRDATEEDISDMAARIANGGLKLCEARARDIFEEIDAKGLLYRR